MPMSNFVFHPAFVSSEEFPVGATACMLGAVDVLADVLSGVFVGRLLMTAIVADLSVALVVV